MKMVKTYINGMFDCYMPLENAQKIAAIDRDFKFVLPHDGAKLEIYLKGGGSSFYTAEWDDPNRGAYYNTPTVNIHGTVMRGGWTSAHPDWVDVPKVTAEAFEKAANAFLDSMKESGFEFLAILLAEKGENGWIGVKLAGGIIIE